MLQIGGNDADNPTAEPRRLAVNILSIAEWLLHGCGVLHVVVMQLLPRRRTRRVSPIHYNNTVRRANQLIKGMVMDRQDITYHKHKGLKESPNDVLCHDGVHLNESHGLPKYVRSVRGAVIVGSRRVGR
ncbi:hypothetical protein KP79_PYT04572 [Mizuhopecten yessoensis]|uniref:SGNH hydrolase-type esterase domain-containing protein n=1 Tax=Mizuhopecten yessoensis TaxID=6573 RepID=A0A210QX22_MIZYE|nr:hypothetical protein KP79_PYT04572 [Mizuhopecten yessoensis]